MKNKIYISIPKPCQESWNAMITTEKSKFCSLCEKNIIDFTKSSDREIVLALTKNKKICGRYDASQLNRVLLLPKEKKSFWAVITATVVALLGLGNQEVKAQDIPKIEQTDKKIVSDSIKNKAKLKTITGVVTDGKAPIPGVNVFIKGLTHRTQTDIDGNYSIVAQKGNILVFSFIGYKNLEKKISKNSKINICLKEETIFMGEVIIQEN